jgi:hypothetical protein
MGLVAVGVVLLLIGAVLLFVPVVPQPNETVSSTAELPYYAAQVSGFALTGTTPIAVSWSVNGSNPVQIVAGACTGSCQNENTSQISSLTTQNGTSGSFTLNQPNGGTILMGVVYGGGPVTVTFKITTALSTVGSALLVIGILVLIAGLILRRTPKAPPAMASQPAAPSSDPMMPPP